MERRSFIRSLAAVGLASILDPAYLGAKDALLSGKKPQGPLPRCAYGKTREKLSIIGFGGIVVKDVTPRDASRFVSEAFEGGVNYFDVAPAYGNAEERLGPALEPYRKRCFLACKTGMRDGAGAARELEASLKKLRTDHVDLYQLHALSTVEEVEKVFAPGGAMETFVKAKKDGKTRYLGFSAHSEEAAHAALDRYPFDSVLFPLGFPTWIRNGFGPSVHGRMKKAGRGILALKAMAHQKWPASTGKQRKVWNKAWYQPFDEVDKAALGLRFTRHLPVTAMVPPGHWKLFKMALDLARAGALVPLNDAEKKAVTEIALESDPIFGKKKPSAR